MFLGSDGGVFGVGAPELVSRLDKHGDVFLVLTLAWTDNLAT
jgi:hypothetical protein